MAENDLDHLFRMAFGSLARSARERNGYSIAELYAASADGMQRNVGQGNQKAIPDLEKGAGWIHPGIFTELLRACGEPNAEDLGRAYAILKGAVGGRSEPYYRSRGT